MKKQDTALSYGIFPPTAGKHPLPTLHDTYDVMLNGNGSEKAAQSPQTGTLPSAAPHHKLPFVSLSSYGFLPACQSHFTAYSCLRLVKYLHFFIEYNSYERYNVT